MEIFNFSTAYAVRNVIRIENEPAVPVGGARNLTLCRGLPRGRKERSQFTDPIHRQQPPPLLCRFSHVVAKRK